MRQSDGGWLGQSEGGLAAQAAASARSQAGRSQHSSAGTPVPGSVVSVRGSGWGERGSQPGDAAANDAAMAALIERMEEVGRVQEQLCQEVVALSLRLT